MITASMAHLMIKPEKLLEYLGRYTHRFAISNYCIQSVKFR